MLANFLNLSLVFLFVYCVQSSGQCSVVSTGFVPVTTNYEVKIITQACVECVNETIHCTHGVHVCMHVYIHNVYQFKHGVHVRLYA